MVIFKNVKNYHFVLVSLLFIMIIFCISRAGLFEEVITSFEITDEGSKFKEFQSYPDVDYWNEWWYANFYDENLKIGGNILLFTRGNLDDIRSVRGVHIDVFNHSEHFVTVGEVVPPEEYISDERITDVVFGQNRLKRLNQDTYELYLKTSDSTFEANLTFTRLTKGFSKKVSLIGERAFFTVPTPLARVEGYITCDGKHFQIKGKGYQEQYYGIWKNVKWDWGVVGKVDDKFSIVFSKADIENNTIGHITVSNDKKLLAKILYPSMDVEPENGMESPPKYHIYGEKDGFAVDLYASPVGDLRIFSFRGNVTENGRILYSLQDEIGFFEHIYK